MPSWYKTSLTLIILISTNITCGDKRKKPHTHSEKRSLKRKLNFKRITKKWFPGLDKSLGIDPLEKCLEESHSPSLIVMCKEERILNESYRFTHLMEHMHTHSLLRYFEQLIEQEKKTRLKEHQELLSRLTIKKILEKEQGTYDLRKRKIKKRTSIHNYPPSAPKTIHTAD